MRPVETILGVDVRFNYLGQFTKDKWGHFLWSVQMGDETFEYRMGLAHANKVGRPIAPKALDVIECLVSDLECAHSTFEDFCSEFGYDTDSRKALETYLKCQSEGAKLKQVFRSKFSELLKLIEQKREA